jgi:hypothetical protein
VDQQQRHPRAAVAVDVRSVRRKNGLCLLKPLALFLYKPSIATWRADSCNIGFSSHLSSNIQFGLCRESLLRMIPGRSNFAQDAEAMELELFNVYGHGDVSL